MRSKTETLRLADGSSVAPELWTVSECASWLRISPEAVRCRLKRGYFPRGSYTYVGRSLRFIIKRIKEHVFSGGTV